LPISERQKKIINLLADGEFHSGTDLAEKLGVSRSAIWKQLNGLAELGLGHAGVSGKGYRLNRPVELLDQEKIYQAVDSRTQDLISSFEIHDQIHSTNSYLMESSQNNTSTGIICLAEHQTAGKGRRGRTWVSPYGSNIYLSILWRFQQQGPAALSGLSLAIGVAAIRALKHQQIQGIGLKWPNDLYCQEKKLGGILVEVSGESDGPCVAVVGLGLNLFLPEAEAENITQSWTDLTKITGKNRLPRNQLAGTLVNHLLPVIAGFEHAGIKTYLDEWRMYDCLKNRSVTLHSGNRQIEGIVGGIDDDGLLVMKRQDGTVQLFASGEVSFNPQ